MIARLARRLATAWMAAFLSLALVAQGAPARADTWAFEQGHSLVTVTWVHLGLSRQSARLRDIAGTVDFDPTNPEAGKVDVAMRVAGLSTGVPELDKLLHSADFFDAEHFPLITFKSTAVRRTGERTGEVAGDLTIMGTTKPVTLQVTWNFSGEHPLSTLNPTYKDKFVSGFSARTRIKRSEWGIARAIPLVSDDIDVSIEVELLRK